MNTYSHVAPEVPRGPRPKLTAEAVHHADVVSVYS